MGQLLLGALLGLGVGAVVGALGSGGFVAVPVLVYLLAQQPHTATAESLIIVIMAALAGLVARQRHGQVRWREGLIFAMFSTIGAFFGGRLSGHVTENYLMLAFATLLLLVAMIMAVKAYYTKNPRPRPREKTRKRNSWIFLPLIAVGVGLITGFFGVGGGFAVVPVLILALGFAPAEAAGTSLIVMIVAASSGLVARIGANIDINWWLTLIFGATSMLAAAAVEPFAAKAKPWVLTTAFSLLLLAFSVFTYAKTFMALG